MKRPRKLINTSQKYLRKQKVIKIISIRMKRNITTDPINIKRAIKTHCNIYGNKLNLDEIGNS